MRSLKPFGLGLFCFKRIGIKKSCRCGELVAGWGRRGNRKREGLGRFCCRNILSTLSNQA